MSDATVFIVDDDQAVARSLRWLIETVRLNVETFASAQAFLDGYDGSKRGCLVLDVRMGGMSGLQLFDLLVERGSRLPVIFLSGHGDIPLAVAAVKKGAFDFVEKPFNDNELVDRVIRAMQFDASRKAPGPIAAVAAARLNQLTPREREVMERILAGKYNKVIADELNIAMRTVEVHRARIFEKMGVKSAVELAQLLSGNR